MRTGIYPPELRLVNLDSDWLYRRLAPGLVSAVGGLIKAGRTFCVQALAALARRLALVVARQRGPHGLLVSTSATSGMALWVMLMLLGYLVLYYV